MNDPIRRYPLMIVRELEPRAPEPGRDIEAGVDAEVDFERDPDGDSRSDVLQAAAADEDAGTERPTPSA